MLLNRMVKVVYFLVDYSGINIKIPKKSILFGDIVDRECGKFVISDF